MPSDVATVALILPFLWKLSLFCVGFLVLRSLGEFLNFRGESGNTDNFFIYFDEGYLKTLDRRSAFKAILDLSHLSD